MRPVDPSRHTLAFSSGTDRETGSILIILILAILLFATLGTAIYTLSTSSSYSKLTANLAARARYAAESGYRYVASEYRNAGTIFAKMSRLESLHGSTHTLPGGLGSFTISIHPYFFITNSSITAGDNLFSARAPGEFPNGFAVPPSVRLFIGTKLYDAGLIAQTQPQNVDFQVPLLLQEDLPPDSVVCLVATTATAQVITSGGSIILAAADSYFPSKNGWIQIGTSSPFFFSFTSKQANFPAGQTTLTGIQGMDADSKAILPLPIGAGITVILKPCVEMTVTGHTADISLGGERTISYSFPILDSGGFGISAQQ